MLIKSISTRFSDIASTIRSSIHKQGERNLIKNLLDGVGYEGVIEVYSKDFNDTHTHTKSRINQLGHLERGTGKHNSNIVYGVDGLCPCITAGCGVKYWIYVIEGSRLDEKESDSHS